MAHHRQRDPRIKVEWANQQILDLDRRINEFLFAEVAPYLLLAENDPDVPERVRYRVQLHKQIPEPILCLTGDIFHNLRSSLDHLLFRIMPPTVKWERFHGFPIAANPGEYHDRKLGKRGKIQGLPDALVQRIDALKPYKGGNDALWSLHELNIIDKHRLLLALVIAQRRTSIQSVLQGFVKIGGWWPGAWKNIRVSKIVPMDDGAVMPPDAIPSVLGMNVDDEPVPLIALNEPGIIQPEPLIPALVQFSNLVEGVIAVFDDIP